MSVTTIKSTRHSYLRPAIVMMILLTLATGVIYPLITTGISTALFHKQAQGSLIMDGDKLIGSELIGQNFTHNNYFWGRPSATSDTPYNAMASGGSNLAVSNPALDKAVADRVAALRRANPQSSPQVPVDLVTASASGLDPQISVEAAQWQTQRVASARGLTVAQVTKLIDDNTASPLVNFLGPTVVNVVQLNHALDQIKPAQ
ncbi:potassium-transporting ATPase subunit KdpC [Hafnia psychrotolerans]|uniref:Potassium-transporting ATPase KdpC subunit n=1 Tax=Hafnia psychrotolerans TaxID=1477018 RepID=A0ABQ1FVR6_9GAMM|nr:potassium-transporting ATPase subunit KdpC [Hafnia psychrotolerans]GGA31191.1 potassium-transporting ATPase KdpC subunit [Hafnia psychrotolerans]